MTAKRFHIRRWLSLAVTLTLSVLSQSVLAQSTFTNPTRIAISDNVFWGPYPSNIGVSGLSGSVSKVTVTLTELNFGFPRDVDILLVGPNGQSVILISDARDDGTGHIINKTLTFDDAALLPLPSDSTLTSGTYKPTNFDSEVDFFSAPAPAGPYGTTLSVFNETTPNGTWSLYMVDDLFDDPFGELPQEITGGWSLAVTTQTTPPSDISVWSITGNLNVAREFHAATLLPDGKVLINGGFGSGPSSSAELYDRATGTWTNTGSSNMAHYYPTATLLPNGKVLVVSDDTVGIPTGGGAELFDPATGTWSLTGRLNNQADRTFHTATLLPNGKVLVAGGANGDFFFIASKSAELYDPATATWTPTGNLDTLRALHTATLLPNGKVLVVGGVESDEGGVNSSAELYDPATGIWTNTGSLSTARAEHTATLLPNGKVLVAGGLIFSGGGFPPTNSAELYDPSTGNWSTTGSFNTPRHAQTATLLPDGKVLVAGGSSTSNVSNTSLKTAELYDPSNGIWSLTSSLNTARQWHTATLLTNGRVLVGGGTTVGGAPSVLNSAELYGSTSTNPIDDPRFFVRQHYLDFLNRPADDLGLAFWTNEITSCGFDPQCLEIKRINVSAAFFLSIEFQQTGYLVHRMYKAAYGDGPSTPVPLTRQEFLPDTQRVGQGVVVGALGWEQQLEKNKNTFASEFVARSRFTTAFPQGMSSEQFVDALNANAGGVLSQSERDQLVSELTSGAKTRAQVLRSVAEDADLAQAEFNKAFVLMQYFGYLRRNSNDAPDTNFAGYVFWLDKLNQFNGNFVQAEMVKAFISSSEYRQRFGQP